MGGTRVRKQQAGGWRQEAAGGVVRAREVVLPWVHVWSTMMSDRFRSVHFARKSSCYAAATKPDLTCSSERVFKKDETLSEHRFNGVTRQFNSTLAEGGSPSVAPPPPLPSHLPPWQV